MGRRPHAPITAVKANAVGNAEVVKRSDGRRHIE
jgi:hypothetical protein